jgi:hypothetical protein
MRISIALIELTKNVLFLKMFTVISGQKNPKNRRFKHHIRITCLILNIFQKKSKEFRSVLTKIDQFKDFLSKKWDLPKMPQFFWFFCHIF